MPRLMGALRVLGFFSLIIVLSPVQFVFKRAHPERPFAIPQLFHRLLVKVLGFRVRRHGAPLATGPTFFVSNHASYLDIPVLNSLTPAAFVAKADVRKWPMIGWLAEQQGTVFIERVAARAGAQKNILREHLMAGKSLVLFPEGTSTEGLSVLPFKSSLFSAVEGLKVSVQPISITCTEMDSLPITRALRPYYAWYGDMTLMGHLWNVFKFGRYTLDVVYHPAVPADSFTDRKTLANYCQQQVARGIQQSISGRGFDLPQIVVASAPVLIEAKQS
jgi:lyso-ornithine lipid O-acyltransferase